MKVFLFENVRNSRNEHFLNFSLRWQKLKDPIGMKDEVDGLLRTHKNLVNVRHYSFIDFEKLGYRWRPDWFSVVRDPIQKVSF